MALQFRRGLDSDRASITPLEGEPIFSTNTKTLFIGDGTTTGGNDIVSAKLAAVSGHIVPALDSTYDLGDSSRKFRDLYLSGNSIHLGDNLILSNQGGVFTAKDSSNNTINISLSGNTTTDLAEGTNKYFTTARADSDARSALLVTDAGGDGSLTYDSASGVFTYTGPSAAEVRAHFSAGEGIDISSGAISAEDATATNKGIASFSSDEFTVTSGAVTIKTDGIDNTHIDFGTGTGQVNTDNVTEGSTNLYFTNTRADARVNAVLPNTGSLTEGSNLYYTDARADARIANALLDEDNMASNSATKVPSQQSVKAYVDAEVAGVVDAAPGALNTLNELAAALGDDANFSTTITNQIAGKLDSAQTIAIIDSAYVSARAGAGTDSAATQAMIDSSLGAQIDSDYIQARQTTPIPAFTKISISGQGDVVADADAASPNWASGTQQAKLTASDGADGDAFGHGVSISKDGTYAVVGAYQDDDAGNRAGTAFIFIRSGSTWTQQAKIQASDAAAEDYFGTSVDIDADGNTVVVGARRENNGVGAAYVFTRSGTSWSQQAKLSPVGSSPTNFAKSVGIADDGDTVVIGSNGGSPANSGYLAIFTRSGSTWSHEQTLVASDAASGDDGGNDCSISGNGLYVAMSAFSDDDGGTNSGSAYIWFYNGSTWSQQVKLAPSDQTAYDKFGTSVSLDIDGDTIIVGAYQDHLNSNNNGSAYIFTRSGTSWSQQAKIQASGTPSNDDEFGAAVSISDDGNTAVSIARREANSGAGDGTAYIFTRSGSTWTEQLSIFGAENVGGNLGFEPPAVEISGDGQTIIAGNHGASSTRGHALVFNAPMSVVLSDTLTLEAGSNVTLTSTPGTDTIAIASSTDSTTTQAMIDSSIGFQVDSAYVQARQSGGAITVQEEGSSLSTAATTLNFVGGNVTASGNGATKTITIGGGGGGGLDSASILSLIDSSHVQSKQLNNNTTIVLQVDSNLSSIDSAQVIHSFPKTEFRTVKYVAQLENDDSNGYHAEEILLTHNDTSVVMTSYAKITIDSDIGTFDASVDSNNVKLTLSPSKINTHVKLKAITIPGADADTLVSIDSDLTSTDSAQTIHTFDKRVHRTMKYTAQLSTPDVAGTPVWTSAPTETAAIQHTGAADGDIFGWSVDIDRNYAIVGAESDDADGTNSGAAYIFYKSGGTWSQQAALTGQSGQNSKAGWAVAIGGTTEGARAAVAMPRYNNQADNGRVAWYTRSGTTWTHQTNVSGPAGSYFGYSIAMSGDTTVVGAARDDTGGGSTSNRGRVYVYTGNGVAQANFTSSDIADGDEFGFSVDIDGDLLVVGARLESGNIGAAYVFERSGTTWTQKAKLTPSDGQSSPQWRFGTAVQCHKGDNGTNTIAVGGEYARTGGAVYVYTGSGTSYTEQAIVEPSDIAAGDRFGGGFNQSISINKAQAQGDTLFIGAYSDDDNGLNTSGSWYLFTRSGSTWTQQYKRTAFTYGPSASGYFGYALAVDDHGSLIVGAPYDDENGSQRGAAYIYDAQTTPSTAGQQHSQEILLTHNGTNVAMTGYAKLLMDSDLGTFDANISGNNVNLTLSPTKTNTSVKLRALRSRI